MKLNRKKIVTAVIFAVTLTLGISALVLAWRLQQEKQITEEEAAAYGDGSPQTTTNILRSEQTWFESHVFKQCLGFRGDLLCENIQGNPDNAKIYYDGPDLTITATPDTYFHAPRTRKDVDNPDGYNHRTPFCTFYQMDRVAGGGYDSGHWQVARDAAGNYCGQVRDDKASPLQLGWRCFDKNLNPTYSDDWDGSGGLGEQVPNDSDWLYKNLDYSSCSACQSANYSWGVNNETVSFSNIVAVNLYASNNSRFIHYQFKVKDGENILFESNPIPATENNPPVTNFTNLSINCKSPVDPEWRDVGGVHTDDQSGQSIDTEAIGFYTGQITIPQYALGNFTRGTQCSLNGTFNIRDALGALFDNTKSYTVETYVRGSNMIGTKWETYHDLWQDPDWRIPGASGVTSGNVCRTMAEPADNPEAVCVGKSINDDDGIDPGQEVIFTIGYENTGDVAGTILITDTVPNGFENVETTTTGCTVSGNTVTCTIPNVAAGATGSITITAKAKSTVRDLNTNNTATVRLDVDGDGIPDDTAPDAAEIAACSTESSTSTPGAQCVNKVDNVETFVNPGDIVTYTIGYKALRTPATIRITDVMPQHTTLYTAGSCALPTECSASTNTKLDCTFNITQALPTYENVLPFCVKVNETGIPLNGVTVENLKVKVWEGDDEPNEFDETCTEETQVKHINPSCDFTTPSIMTIRVADLATTSFSLTTTGNIGTHPDLDFRWTATGGTLSSTTWHASSGTPANGRVTDTITWSPPTDAEENDTFDIKVYVRPTGSSDQIGVSAEDCESTTTITALDLICNWMVPNNNFDFFPFDMTFKADIGGDQGALFTYDLNFGDNTTHYTGSGTVAAGATVELPYIPPQDQPHRYDSTTPMTYNPVLTVTNTETGETSICPTVLGGRTQSEWTIVKDSDVDTCVAENSTVTYSIVVTNTGDYTADLAQVRDTVDAKIDTSTIANIRECDSNGQNCTTYDRTDVLSGRTITWPGRTYVAGESRKYMYTVQINSAGDYYNIAEAVPETGEIVRDDELFPTCGAKTPVAPKTGSLSTTAYIAILGMLTVAAGYYTYNTKAGAQIVANVMGKTGRSVRRSLNRKETFERDAIRSEKGKLKS